MREGGKEYEGQKGDMVGVRTVQADSKRSPWLTG